MGIVSTGTLVLCLIIKPNIDGANTAQTEDSKPQVQKVLGTIKEVFQKKVVRDSKDVRLAIHENKDMLVVETLDGEAQITIGADACKRVVEKDEFDTVKKRLSTTEEKKEIKNTKPSDDIIKEKPQTESEKLELLKQLDK